MYATPHDIIPAYKRLIQAALVVMVGAHWIMPAMECFISTINIGTAVIIPQVKNCINDNLTPSTRGEKWSTTRI